MSRPDSSSVSAYYLTLTASVGYSHSNSVLLKRTAVSPVGCSHGDNSVLSVVVTVTIEFSCRW